MDPSIFDTGSYQNFVSRIPLQEEADIRDQYGLDAGIPFVEPKRPKSPSSRLTQAGEYVIKMEKKGYVKMKEHPSSPRSVYKTNIVQTQIRKKVRVEKNIPQESNTQLESFQEFWFNTNTVKQILEELTTLPYHDRIDQSETITRFNEQISSFVRVLHHEGKLDHSKNSRTQLNKTMKAFVSKAYDVRKSLIRSLITNKKIKYEDLDENAKNDFPEFKPQEKKDETVVQFKITPDQQKPSPKDAAILDSQVIDHVTESIVTLPSDYKVTMKMIEERAGLQSRRNLKRSITQGTRLISTALAKSRMTESYSQGQMQTRSKKEEEEKPMFMPISKHKTSIVGMPAKWKPPVIEEKPQEEEVIYDPVELQNLYWKMSDPLKKKRQGELQSTTLEQLNILTDPVSIDFKGISEDDYPLPFALQSVSPPLQPPQPLTPTNTIQKKRKQNRNDVDVSPSEDELDVCPLTTEEKIHQLAMAYQSELSYDVHRQTSEDVSYLLSHTSEVLRENGGADVHERLNAIWDRLGFSIQQKLDVMIKYSSNTDESNKLTEAIEFWEKAESTIASYDHAYQDIKSFLQMEAATHPHKNIAYSQLEDVLIEAEHNILQISQKLKTLFGDELVLRRRKATDLMQTRRMKINIMKKKQGIMKIDH